MKSKIIFSKIIPILLFCVISLASCGRGANTVPSVRFDRTTAFENMTEIAEIGQRHSGSEGALSTVELIEKKLTEYGVPHFRDEWYEDTAYGKILFRNVVAQIKVPGKNNLILLGTHYDTKKLENCPGFQGANDGASGVAILLECSRILLESRAKLKKNLEIVFFDGEECMFSYSEKDGLHGSKRHLRKLIERGEKCDAVIITDMLADADLDAIIPSESDSKLAAILLKTASELGVSKHFRQKNINMVDDHCPFLEVGIPSLLLIDFNYGPNSIFWHSSGDRLENVSEQSLGISGELLYHFVIKITSN
ncbi:MAG TPA: M20/M25/M40 family metallo-hydrolase [Victivallales bacterium]|nr:M20/M25/M40 family metallo-hydrolase [Victivallales bacterium]